MRKISGDDLVVHHIADNNYKINLVIKGYPNEGSYFEYGLIVTLQIVDLSVSGKVQSLTSDSDYETEGNQPSSVSSTIEHIIDKDDSEDMPYVNGLQNWKHGNIFKAVPNTEWPINKYDNESGLNFGKVNNK